jgi:hypothetical protein
LGTEAAIAIENQLVSQGWNEVGLNVLTANPHARQFWERMGYSVYEEGQDSNQRPCWKMHKFLTKNAPVI